MFCRRKIHTKRSLRDKIVHKCLCLNELKEYDMAHLTSLELILKILLKLVIKKSTHCVFILSWELPLGGSKEMVYCSLQRNTSYNLASREKKKIQSSKPEHFLYLCVSVCVSLCHEYKQTHTSKKREMSLLSLTPIATTFSKSQKKGLLSPSLGRASCKSR